MIRLQKWFVQWLRGWPKSARQSRAPVALDMELAEVAMAKECGDTRRLHVAIERARRERKMALARELGREWMAQ